MQKIFSDEPYSKRCISPAMNEDAMYSYAPVSFDGIETRWGMLAVTNYDNFIGAAKHIIYVSIGVALICLILLGVGLTEYFRESLINSG